MKNLVITLCLAFVTMALAACGKEETTTTPTQTEAAAGVSEGTGQMAYVCPMRCEGSASMKPGKCPVCRMELEKNPKYTAAADSTAAQ